MDDIEVRATVAHLTGAAIQPSQQWPDLSELRLVGHPNDVRDLLRLALAAVDHELARAGIEPRYPGCGELGHGHQ